MLTKIHETMLPKFFTQSELENSYLKNNIEMDIKKRKVCPLCNNIYGDYIEFNYHLANHHNTEEVESNLETLTPFIDPLFDVRNLENMKSSCNEDMVTIGQFFGDIITSVHNQHVLLNLIGKTGTGKSNAAMYIGEVTAKYVAAKMGGKPNPDKKGEVYSSDPHDYFNIDNIAIMKLDTIIPVLQALDDKKFNIFILDDIGGEYNARNFMQKQNKEMNKIFQTFRDSNTLLIFTTPDSFLIDKVGRKLAHFQIEMVAKMYNRNVSIGKLFMLQESYHKGKTLFPYIVYNGVQYKRIIFKRVSKDLANNYEAKRSMIRQQFTADSITSIQGGDGEEKDNKPTKVTKYMEIAPGLAKKMESSEKMSKRELSRYFNTSVETITNSMLYIKQCKNKGLSFDIYEDKA